MSTESAALGTEPLRAPDSATVLADVRYLLVLNVPLYRDAQGRRYADDLWYKDLCQHAAYLRHLTLLCPVFGGTLPPNAVLLDNDPKLESVRFVELAGAKSEAHAIVLLPGTVRALWQAVRQADIVHTGIAGWPIPLGWITIPLARLFRRPSVVIVESAPWRLQPGLPMGLESKMRAWVFETLGRWCVGHTDLQIFTQEEYQRSLLGADRGHIIHASWIDEDVILSDQEARGIWKQKVASKLKVAFVGQLKASKGVLVLLEAAKLLAEQGAEMQLDILGSGELSDLCNAAASEAGDAVRIRALGTVAYGEPLFQLLRQYHAIVVPSLADEQPRIVYDAYSQAVPVLASDTGGLRGCVQMARTGWLVKPNDAVALSSMLQRAAHNLAELQALGLEALKVSRLRTHQRMHAERKGLLAALVRERVAAAEDQQLSADQ